MTIKHPTHLVVDGSNIATEGRNAPSLEQLDEAVRAILDEFPHDGLTVVVDATFGHRIAEDERPAYEEAILAGEIVAPPAGAIGRGDAFILQVAAKAGATVFSNDSFQEFHGEHEWLFEEGRLIGGKPVPGIGWVFVPRVPVRGPLSRRAVRDSRRGRTTTTPRPSSRRSTSTAATTPLPRPEDGTIPPPPLKRTRETARDRSRASTPAGGSPAETSGTTAPSADADGRATKSAPQPVEPTEALTPPTVFLGFITRHRIGSVIEARVDHFSSHGAYVVADGARCYLPTKTMGDPPPSRARDLVNRDDVVRVEVQSLDAERRGINVRFVELVEQRSAPALPFEGDAADENGDAGSTEPDAEGLSQQPELPRSDTDVPVKRTASATRTGARKAPSGRAVREGEPAPTKKAAAEATPSPRAAKAVARKVPAKKATRRATASTPEPQEPTTEETPVKATRRRATKRTAVTADAPAESTATTGRRTTAKRAAKAAAGTDATASAEAPAKRTTRARKAVAPTAEASTESAPPAKKATGRSTRVAAEVSEVPAAPAKKATTRKASTRKAAAGVDVANDADTAGPATKRTTKRASGTAKKAARKASASAEEGTATKRTTRKAAAGTTTAATTTRKAASRRSAAATADEATTEAPRKAATRRTRRTSE